MTVENRAKIDEAPLAEIDAAIASQRSLADVVRDTFARGQTIADVVVQDEFTHDVVVPWRGELHLVYDTT